jgi:hypothetical protein
MHLSMSNSAAAAAHLHKLPECLSFVGVWARRRAEPV